VETCDNVTEDLKTRGLPVPPVEGVIRFLGPLGCVLPPWQRPYCSRYHCWFHPPVSPSPKFRKDEKKWLKEYSRLQDAIESENSLFRGILPLKLPF